MVSTDYTQYIVTICNKITLMFDTGVPIYQIMSKRICLCIVCNLDVQAMQGVHGWEN